MIDVGFVKRKIAYEFDRANRYSGILREIVEEKAQKGRSKSPVGFDFIDYMKKQLKLNKREDFHFLCTCMDLLEDTILATKSYIEETNVKNDIGEKYLRLYGLLNAVYIHANSIIEMYRIVNMQNSKKFRNSVHSLRVIKIRNKLGSHGSSYIEDDENISTYVISRVELNNQNVTFFNNKNLKREQLNIISLLEEYICFMNGAMKTICTKLISTIYKSNENKIGEYVNKINDIEEDKGKYN